MRIILISLLLLVGCTSNNNYRDDHPLGDLWMFNLLKMQIVPTFQAPVIYEVTNGEPFNLYVTKYKGQGGYEWGGIEEKYMIQLTRSEYDQIVHALEKVLSQYPLKDEVGGKDGSIWVLESSMYQYVKLTSWSPKYKTEERGYSALVELCNILSKIGARKNA